MQRLLVHRWSWGIAVVATCWLFSPVLAQQPEDTPPPQLQYVGEYEHPLYAVAYAPDGRTIIGGSIDGTVSIWDRPTGQLIRSFRPHEGPVLKLAISPDGLQFVTGGVDHRIRFFDMPHLAPRAELANLPEAPNALAASEDGALVVTGHEGNVVRLLNRVQGSHVRDFPGVTAPVRSVILLSDPPSVLAATADGRLLNWNRDNGQLQSTIFMAPLNRMAIDSDGAMLAGAGEDGMLRLLNWPPIPVHEFPPHQDQATAVVLSADGTQALSGGADQGVRLYDVQEGTLLRALPGQTGRVTATALNPPATLAAASSDTGLIRIWDTDEGTAHPVLTGHQGAIHDLRFHPDADQPRLVSAGADSTIRIWQLPRPVRSLEGHAQPVDTVSLSADGSWMATTSNDRTIRLWKQNAEEPSRIVEELPQPARVSAFSPDGQQFAFGDLGGTVQLQETEEGTPQGAVFAHAGGVSGLAYHPDEPWLISSGLDGTVKIWELPFAEPEQFDVDEEEAPPVNAVVTTSDGKRVFVGGADGSIRTFDTETGKETDSSMEASGAVTALSLSPDEEFLAASTSAGLVSVWNLADGSLVETLAGHAGAIHAVLFSPEGDELATAGEDGTVRRWHRPVSPRSPDDLDEAARVVTVSADEKWGLTGQADGTAHLFSIEDGQLLQTFEGGEAPIHSVAIRPDNELIATADTVGIIRFWNPENGQLVGHIEAHQGPVTKLAFHPQQPLLASSGDDGMVRVWQLPVEQRQTVFEHEEPVTAVAVSRDGEIAVSASTDGTLQIHTAEGNQQIDEEQSSPIRSLALSADQNLLVAGNDAGTLLLYQMQNGELLAELTGHENAVTGVAVHPQNKQIVSVGQDGTLRHWTLPEASPPLEGHTQPIDVVAVSPNRQLLATAGRDNQIRIWNLQNYTHVRALSGHSAEVTSLAWKADNSQLVSGSADKTVRVWNVGNGQQLAAWEEHATAPTAVAITPNGAQVVATQGNAIQVWNVEQSEIVHTLEGHTQPVTSLLLTADGQTLISGARDNRVRLWSMSDQQAKQNIDHQTPVNSLALSPNGEFIAVGGDDKQIKLYALSNGNRTATLPDHSAAIASVSISPNNERIAAASTSGEVRVWNAEGELLQRYHDSETEMKGLGFGANDQTLLAGASDNRVHRLEISLQRLIRASEKPLASVALTPDGNSALTGSTDPAVTLWNLSDGEAIRKFDGATAAINCVAVNPAGTQVMAAGDDKFVRIWTLSDGQPVESLEHPVPVRSLTVHPAESRIATSADDGLLRVWDIGTGQMLERFSDHEASVRSIAFGPDGRMLFSGSQDKSVRRSTIAGTLVIEAHEGGATDLLFTPDGNHLITCGADKLARQFDLKGEPVRQWTGSAVPLRAISLHAESNRLAAAADDQTVLLWNLTQEQPQQTMKVPVSLRHLRFIDADRLMGAGADQRVRFFQISQEDRLLEELHTESAVTSVAVLPESRQLLIGTAEQPVSIRTFDFVQSLDGHEGAVTRLAYLPDGQSLISGGADKTLRHWNFTNGQAIRQFSGHEEAITGMALIEEGPQLVTSSADMTIRVWNVANGQNTNTITADSPFRTLSLHAESGRLLTSSNDHSVRVWDLLAGRELQRFLGHASTVGAVAFIPGGEQIVSGSADKSIRLWAIAARRVIGADPEKVHDLKLLPSGDGFVTAGEDRHVRMWDLQGEQVRQFSALPAAVRNVDVHPDGIRVAAGGDPTAQQTNVYIWDAEEGHLLHTIATPAAVVRMAFNSQGRLAVSGADQQVRFYSTDDGRLLEALTAPQVLRDLTFANGESTLIGAGADRHVHLIEPSLETLLTGHEGAVLATVFTPEGTGLITAGNDQTIREWNLNTGEVIATYQGMSAAVLGMTLTADGRHLLAGEADGKLFVWERPERDDEPVQQAARIQPARTFEHPAAVRAVSVSADGLRLATACDDQQIRLWDFVGGKEIERLAGHSGAIFAVDLNHDGSLLVSAGSDRSVRRWTPSVTTAVDLGDAGIRSVSFSANGEQLFALTEENLIQQFSTPELELVREFSVAEGTVTRLAASPSGNLLAAGTDNGHAVLWNTEDEDGEPVIIETPSPIADIVLGAKGDKLIVAGEDHIIRHYGFGDEVDEEGRPLWTLTQENQGHEDAVGQLVLLPDDQTLLSLSADQTVREWFAASQSPRLQFNGHQGPIYDLAFSPNGRWVAATGGDQTVRVWQTEDGQPVAVYEEHSRPVNSVLLQAHTEEPDPNDPDAGPVETVRMISSGFDRTIRQWDVSGTTLQEFSAGILGTVYSLALSPDGKTLISAGADKTWQAWNLETGLSDRTVEGHNHTIRQVAYNANGQRLASLDASGKLFIWNTANGLPLFHQQLPVQRAYSFAYSPDGTELIVGTDDRRILCVRIPEGAR